ncbi:putative Choline Transporter-like (CTL) Family Protein [Monocercomonoides exilis]|uniref:putative Choline Transporter-like (CTL) Family Protein n=1 Tax=Monocercomonoides exilis TaxID=2049356 RepID=UPI003559E019|nr:putative Choline Transporter-like (CTL) Family Protein [Monocercomonoides exilis]|eukprot:MONOS_4237.1-p1 / transcript=MONOS_4237.1 / gene=MONOS_4237 / organism=Monocercomonoides_exilis_PA203 / gene_product=Choline Transporter-like (CTL) Family Protein / transcript_product=Choline Transporter-like (CTL) Family Protein / location=Mono_scaffold00110:52602-54338(+) / protein_length=579 / sequence_SO=supercontig / SO=protein_coding / is_pseudo=false
MQVASKRKDDKKDILTEDIDLVSKVWVVLVGYSIVTVVSLLWILCMCRCASSCLRASVWVSVIVDLLSGIGFIVIAAFQSKKSHNDTFSNYDDAVMYVSGAISAVFFIFLLVMLIINNENVSIVSEMFKEAAKAIKDRAGLLLVVIILAIISIVVGWLSSYVSIVYYQCMFRIYFNIGFNALTIINFILLIFANIFAVWFESFIEHLNKAIIAATTVEWYYSEGDPNKRKWPILHAIKYTLSKSIGAVAFGSFLDYLNEALEDIAKSIGTFAFAFSLVGNFFNYCSKPNKKQNNVEEEEEDSGFVASCCMCLFRFAMKFYAVFFYAVALALFLVAMIVKLIGSKPSDFVEAECERIYAMSCIEGKPFIESSKDTMCLIVRNIDSVITFDIIASSLKKSIKWSITLVANIVCLLIWRPDFFGLSDPVDYPVWSILFGESLIFNYLNESIIIDTFMTAVNSILICRLTKKEYDDHKDQGFVEINRDLTDPFAFMNNEIEESVNKCMEKIENRGKNIHQSSVLYLERQANRFQPERPEAATEPMVRLPTENTSQSSNQSSEREMTIQEENNGNSSDESAKV